MIRKNSRISYQGVDLYNLEHLENPKSFFARKQMITYQCTCTRDDFIPILHHKILCKNGQIAIKIYSSFFRGGGYMGTKVLCKAVFRAFRTAIYSNIQALNYPLFDTLNKPIYTVAPDTVAQVYFTRPKPE